jgi:hypothetical protein
VDERTLIGTPVGRDGSGWGERVMGCFKVLQQDASPLEVAGDTVPRLLKVLLRKQLPTRPLWFILTVSES